MRMRWQRTLIGLASVYAVAGLPVSAARADDEPDVDIDELKATLAATEQEWLIDVVYEIEIELEDTPYTGGFELVLMIESHDRMLRDPEGRLVQIVVPLPRPEGVDEDEDHDEFTIKDVATIHIPLDGLPGPDKLRLYASVFGEDARHPLDRKREKVKWPEEGARRSAWGVEVGLLLQVGGC